MGSKQSSIKQPEPPVVDKTTFTQLPNVTIAHKGTETLTFSFVTLDRIPEKIFITILKYPHIKDNIYTLPIETINLMFGGHPDLFSQESRQDLKTISRKNRDTKDFWYPHDTLCLSVRNDFPEQFYYRLVGLRPRTGVYNLSFTINVHNPYDTEVTPSIMVDSIF